MEQQRAVLTKRLLMEIKKAPAPTFVGERYNFSIEEELVHQLRLSGMPIYLAGLTGEDKGPVKGFVITLRAEVFRYGTKEWFEWVIDM